MGYPNRYEYDDVTMSAMYNALKVFFGSKFKNVKFYKMNESENYVKKVDGIAYLILNNDYELNLQIKRSNKHSNSFSVSGKAMQSYLENDYDIQGLLVGTAYSRDMYLFRWDDFVEFAKENHNKWKVQGRKLYK